MTVAAARTTRGSERWAQLTRDFAVAAHPRLFTPFFCLLALGAAIAMVASLPTTLAPETALAALLLTGANAVAGRIRIVASNENSWDLTTVPQLLALILLPAEAALLVASISTLVSEIWMRPPWVRAVFNVAQITCAMALATWVLAAAGGPATAYLDLLDRLPWFVLAAASEQLTNKSLVVLAISLYRGQSPLPLWWEMNRSALIGEAALGCAALLIAFGWLLDSRVLALLAIPLATAWLSLHQGRAVERSAETRLALSRASDRLHDVADAASVVKLSSQLLCELCADGAVTLTGAHRAQSFREGISAEGVVWLDDALAGKSSRVSLATAQRRLLDEGENFGEAQIAWLSSSANPERRLVFEPLCRLVAAALRRTALLQQAAEVETLREVTRARSELLAAVSHELHPPLGLVVGYAELLQSRASDDESRHVAGRVVEVGNHLTHLVNDLLDSARLETGRYSLHCAIVDLGPLTQSAVDAARAAQPHTTYILDLPPASISVEADPARLLQILGNLLTNAARHGRPSGTVRVILDADDHAARIAIEDDGPGIPAPDRERVFEKFYRGSMSSRGLGLGLSIARDLVLAHGGTIRVEDAQSGGARFVVELPLAAAMA